ncbi:MAG: glycosyltransferase family 4 protein [Acidobacteriia bacterium]|nr:glycosyltransferase family 4 protein [Terriglobia bacterium]
MKIAQVAPLYESVPPAKYGGTERIVSYLTEELVREGHDVTLFASGDSKTSAHLVPQCRRALRTDERCLDPLAPHVTMIEQVWRRAHEFDILHFHVDYLHYSVCRRLETPHLTTLHGRLDLPELPPLYRTFSDVPVNSISQAQRKPLPFANWVGTVAHGLPEALYAFDEAPGNYLTFVGRVSPEKGLDRAIEIARRADMPLKIAAKVDQKDRDYFEAVLRPAMNHPSIEFLEEIGDGEKQELIGKARAVLFPINWPEPFGIVMIEALACGTPVIAFRCGSVPEVIEEGVTGFVVSDVGQAVKSVERLASLSRKQCRAAFEQKFSAGRMAAAYTALYEKLQSPGKDVEVEVHQCL